MGRTSLASGKITVFRYPMDIFNPAGLYIPPVLQVRQSDLLLEE